MTTKKEIRNMLLNLMYYRDCDITHIFTERNLRMEVSFLKESYCYSLMVSVPVESVFNQRTLSFQSIDYAAGAIEQILFNNDNPSPFIFDPSSDDLPITPAAEPISITIKGC
ncbi:MULTISPECIES: hypothetical protein [Bacillaceae]|uniref:Uncharacterized protein n=2 Tax=Bacillus infantis TaxID=324767 RepID=U5LBQ0_9BACI|nr:MULTISPECIES: hypothetical protein [Bacillus]OXT18290.1 hypothetical protein B9K06_07250 [Bacillus sp. OG2]AGX04828.1 hypothetical protein N288_14640 [Bacillus infantis NRRL B-14911]EAR68084.1 hypothetical protein B14911_25535 [Bacillus sp. NRRL B-14911]MCA1035231.1 hypothetical protein [Bacillus infantis]MCK6208078.1 hypothetical protein [Bacillus infantis]